ncbi:MAG TPA: hypothetical protein VEB23_03460, partial [Ramlibacter sp.]|nr:hypothetical protein [Ramlibacter sp.]
MTKTRIPALSSAAALSTRPPGGGLRARLGSLLAVAWRRAISITRRVLVQRERDAMVIEGHYGSQAVSMRLDRDDARHYARLARQHGLQPSLAGYLD